MNILQIYELDPLESIGGVENAVFQLSKELVKLGHNVTILTGAGTGKGEIQKDGVRIIRVDPFGTMSHTFRSGSITLTRQFLFLLTNLTRETDMKYDIYHGHIYTSGILAYHMAKKYHGIAVNTIHGSYYPVWDKLVSPLAAIFYKIAEKRLALYLAKNSHLQVHVSTYFAEQVLDWGGDVKVIPNGVDPTRFYPVVKEGSVLPVILAARRLVRKNGLEFIILAMEYLKDECKLVIIGDGPERRCLELMAKKTGNVEFLGAVPHEEIPGYIAGADIAVIPSIIEASSLFMLEAMAMGKPVIASDVGGLPEILGDAGILVPPGDVKKLAGAIRTLLKDPDLCKKCGNMAHRRVMDNFTWEKMAHLIEKEYQRLYDEQNS